MTPIPPRPASSFLGPEFNRFLFAPVGTDRAGGQLSVVSALARLDLDAWAEAAALARLPRDAAVHKLSGLLRRYPDIPRMTQDSTAIAARLLALLPARAATIRPPARIPGRWAAASGAAGIGILVALGLLLSLQVAAQRPQTHAAASPGSAPASLAPGQQPASTPP